MPKPSAQPTSDKELWRASMLSTQQLIASMRTSRGVDRLYDTDDPEAGDEPRVYVARQRVLVQDDDGTQMYVAAYDLQPDGTAAEVAIGWFPRRGPGHGVMYEPIELNAIDPVNASVAVDLAATAYRNGYAAAKAKYANPTEETPTA